LTLVPVGSPRTLRRMRRGKNPWIPIATALRMGGGSARCGQACTAPGNMGYDGFDEMGRMALVKRENRLGLEGGLGYIDSNSGRTWFGGGGNLGWPFPGLSFFEGVLGFGEAGGFTGVSGMEETEVVGV
jgi:hypothetical protein